MLFKGRVDGLVVKIKPEVSTVSPQDSDIWHGENSQNGFTLFSGVAFDGRSKRQASPGCKPAHGRAAAAVSINVIAIRPRPIRDKIDATSFEKP